MTLYHRPSAGTFGHNAAAVAALLRAEGHSPPADLAAADLTDFDFALCEPSPPPAASWDTRAEEAAPVDGVQQWALAPNGRTLDDLKTDLRNQVTERRDQAFEVGFAPATGPLAGHRLQVRNETDKINWLTSATSYSAAVAAGAGAVPGATFRTMDNATVVVTFAEGAKIIVQDMAAWGQSIMQRSWDLKDQIDAAPTAEAALAIDKDAGWP